MCRVRCPAVRGEGSVLSCPWYWTVLSVAPGLWRADLLYTVQKSHLQDYHSKVANQATTHGQLLGLTVSAGQYPSFMAVARKIKTLLTVNILVFVGIILFSVYCRIQDRSEELIQIGRISDQRLRARNGKVSNLVDRQSILQRLERLEDVVYNQLNGKDSQSES